MKRSRHLELALMRQPVPRLLCVAVAMASLGGCGGEQNSRPVSLYRSLDECHYRPPGSDTYCAATQEIALKRAGQSAPVYAQLSDCEADFGRDGCEERWDRRGRYLVSPRMHGWIADRRAVPDTGSCPAGYERVDGECVSASPAYQGSGGGGSYGGRWYNPDGSELPRTGEGQVRAEDRVFRDTPKAPGGTLRRGGFGQMAAKASGGGKSGFGWGS